jgi:hypothetical protein
LKSSTSGNNSGEDLVLATYSGYYHITKKSDLDIKTRKKARVTYPHLNIRTFVTLCASAVIKLWEADIETGQGLM